MENNLFILKHKDVDAGIIEYNVNDIPIHIKTLDEHYMPFQKKMDINEFTLWWKYRAVPDSRIGIKDILAKNGCETSLEMLKKNLALSLTDSYWICPIDYPIKWDEINLYDRIEKKVAFKNINDIDMPNDANSTLNGILRKYAEYNHEKWQLIKYGETENGQQCINEVFAGLIHQTQDFSNYVTYTTHKDTNNEIYCKCNFFTNKNIEMVSAFELMYSEKRDNSVNEYNHFINICKHNGLDEEYVRKFLDYQTLTDFVITNTDRHYRNFGVLRDTSTLQIQKLVPIFDNGNSMFYNKYSELSRENILQIPVVSFYNQEEKLLKNVTDVSIVNVNTLPDPVNVMEFYINHGLREEKAKIISLNYSHKLDLLNELQHGLTVSLYSEQHEKKEDSIYHSKAVTDIENIQSCSEIQDMFIDNQIPVEMAKDIMIENGIRNNEVKNQNYMNKNIDEEEYGNEEQNVDYIDDEELNIE